MPISNRGTRLSVSTNIGGTLYENESHRDLFYGRNQQKGKTLPALTAPGNTRPFGHNRGEEEPEVKQQAVAPDKKIEEAVEKDLSKRGVKHRQPKTQTKKQNDKRNDD